MTHVVGKWAHADHSVGRGQWVYKQVYGKTPRGLYGNIPLCHRKGDTAKLRE